MDRVVCTIPKFRYGVLPNGEHVEVPIDGLLAGNKRNYKYKKRLKELLYKSQHSEPSESLVQEWENFFFDANMEIVDCRHKKSSFFDIIKSLF